MAVNAYLILDGVDGPSERRKKAIEIVSFDYFAASTSTVFGASGTIRGRPKVSNVHLTKGIDKTSPLLFWFCVLGTVVKTATLCYDKPMGDIREEDDYFKRGIKREDYFTIEMTNAVITSVEFEGSLENLTETVSLAFEKVKIRYNPEAPRGNSLKGFVETGFDLRRSMPF